MKKYSNILIAFLILFAVSSFEAKNVNYDSFQNESIQQSFEQSTVLLPTQLQTQNSRGILYRLFIDDGNPLTNVAFLGGILSGVMGALGIGGGSAPAPPIYPPQPQYLPPPPQQNNNNNNNNDSGGGMGGMMPMIMIAGVFMIMMFMGKK